jgi:hypothetical protein
MTRSVVCADFLLNVLFGELVQPTLCGGALETSERLGRSRAESKDRWALDGPHPKRAERRPLAALELAGQHAQRLDLNSAKRLGPARP